ncbi:hypothetical protein EPUS_06974 [Endocarpon pusillum Z07020]|uniref:Protein kinase domain-containing protein n=1 Tax=Endocarpon pusillum (strain Z07020 / HMAS-L-300199) TaxID=1263415 RepID=U1GWE5_ENDPU|nr:uncharacterized protein EPUS_06974 [Endocarpon pusillum Z07020]ERF76416.1 hypothetical protein EPUS_06974 [Endocarpon pusillum Z07020]
MTDAFEIRTMKRKNVKGLTLSPRLLPPPTGDVQISSATSSDEGRADNPEITVDFRFDLKAGYSKNNLKAKEWIVLKNLGQGAEGQVTKVQHVATKLIMTPFFGAIQNDGGEVVMYREYMDVGSLETISQAFGPVRMDVLGKIAEAILGALTYLYTYHRIIHRDVKPSKMLVNSCGQIKLSDFGVSSHLINSITETFVGTRIYLAPERVQGSPYTVKADVWAVGLTLLELAIGKFPFGMDENDATSSPLGVIDLIQRIAVGPSPRLPKSNIFPTVLEKFIEKCLMKDPKDRPTLLELYEHDAFLLAAKRTPVDLKAWAVGLMERQDRLPERLSEETLLLSKADPKAGPRPDELGGCSAEDRMTLAPFIRGLQKLTSMESLEATKKHCVPSLCHHCKQLLDSDVGLRGSGKLKRREVEDGARRLKCPLCQLLVDCLPPVTASHISNTTCSSGRSHMVQNTTHAVLKVGLLNEFMDPIMKIGAQFEDWNTQSHCAFQMAAAWSYTCLTSHSKCMGAAELALPVLPTRVIDVEPSDGSKDVRLHSGEGERAFYFTLSYTWNQSKAAPFQTVGSNLDAYKLSIPLLTLPQTMQDAILITRRFGVRYLWIDALCIIQDSEDDWRSEAKQMARIYKNALLTIAAAADTIEGTQGCFRPRSRLRTRPFDSNSAWPNGCPKYIFASRRLTGDGARPLSTLDTRAWVLQEQLLSPRVLSYSNKELYWDCISLNASETFPDGIPDFYDAKMKSLDFRLFKEAILGGSETNISHEQFHTSWMKVVEEYSERKMTRERDKLAALLGVAKEAAIFLKDEFLVGLWRSRLWRHLLWWVKEPDMCIRPRNFTAPTWSWTSINAPISYELLGLDRDVDVYQCIETIHVEAESNQTLPLLSGKLVVRGKLVPMMAQGPQDASGSSALANLPAPMWREDIVGTDPASVQCLIVAVSSCYVYALGLVALEDAEHHYNRVGMVNWRARPRVFGWDEWTGKWGDAGELETITCL